MHKSLTAYFGYFSHGIKKKLGELYTAFAIVDLATAMVLLFEPVYFVSVLGWSISSVFFFFAQVYFFYIIFVPFGGKFASSKGYERSLIWSIPFQIGYWLLLFSLPKFPEFAVVAAIFFALQKTFFWPAFNAYLAKFSDKDQRARESSFAWSISQVSFIVGPFLGGIISDNFGVGTLLVIASAIYFCMFIPLFAVPRSTDRTSYRFRDTVELYKKYPREAVAYAGFGEELYVLVGWPIFIFLAVPDFFNFGTLIAVATLISTVIMLYGGKLMDKSKKEEDIFLKYGVVISSLVWLIASFARGLIGVFSIDTLLRIGRILFFTPVVAHMYNRAADEKTMAYSVFFEQTLSIGKVIAALLGTVIFLFTENFVFIFILAALFTLLYFVLERRKHLFTS